MLDINELIKQQIEAYSKSKPFAGKQVQKAEYLCPICNIPFTEGTKASADFIDNPESHTNRGVSHGGFGYVTICNTCKYERILRQLLLGNKPEEIVVLMPRMNISYGSGKILTDKINSLYAMAFNIMNGDNENPDKNVSFALTQIISRNSEKKDVYNLNSEELVKLISYQASDSKVKEHRKNLEKSLKEEIGETVEELNIEWETDFNTCDEAVEALIKNEVKDASALSIRAEAYKLNPSIKVICETPNLILFPLMYPIAVSKESQTNSGIRQLFISILFGLSLDCTVAIIKDNEDINFLGGEGVAFVPSLPELRSLIGKEWLDIDDAEKWFKAIKAASILAISTAYPERSNLYEILKAPTQGHILRRIEQKSEQGQAVYYHIKYLEELKEVLR
jgi:hypothetical protein